MKKNDEYIMSSRLEEFFKSSASDILIDKDMIKSFINNDTGFTERYYSMIGITENILNGELTEEEQALIGDDSIYDFLLNSISDIAEELDNRFKEARYNQFAALTSLQLITNNVINKDINGEFNGKEDHEILSELQGCYAKFIGHINSTNQAITSINLMYDYLDILLNDINNRAEINNYIKKEVDNIVSKKE